MTSIIVPEVAASAVMLTNPKYPHNIGAALRACAAFGAKQLWVTGDRAQWETTGKGTRLPREERMREYKDKVELIRSDRPFDFYEGKVPGQGHDYAGVVPVAVEISPTAEPLVSFEHPGNALYIFGPEDGSISKVYRRFCHRFVIIPSDHCLNLAAAVSCILMHRRLQRQMLGLEPVLAAYDTIQEDRG